MLVHPCARALLPVALRMGVSANAVSVAGLATGAFAAWCFAHWQQPALVVLGLLAAIGWLVFDGLDGMVARATGTASPFGRILDGLCDHGVFALIYVALAVSLHQPLAWLLAIAAGLAHAVQSSLYEGERARFHRRLRGDGAPTQHASLGSRAVRAYDAIAGSVDRLAAPFDRALAASRNPVTGGQRYGAAAVPAMKAMSLLSANVRVVLITAACLLARPMLFWWTELVGLSLIAVITIAWHRRIERREMAGLVDPAPFVTATSNSVHQRQ
jgi:CDP-diacylglycerol--serine O-phosphatidyltransferase